MSRKGILKLDGAHCGSCAFTIEHAGRKVKGVSSIRVFSGEGRVEVEYDGEPSVLDKIAAIVDTIGHSAEVVETDAANAAPADS
jgi:copper chaperone CopZ